jgi:hypothetical protein
MVQRQRPLVFKNDITLRLPPSDPNAIDKSRPPILAGWLLPTNALSEGASVGFFPSDDPAFRDMYVTFHLPNPERHGWIAGDVFVDWPEPGAPPTPPPAPTLPDRTLPLHNAGVKSITADTTPDPDSGEVINFAFAAMTSDQQTDMLSLYQYLIPPKLPLNVQALVPVALSAPPPQPTAVPSVSVGPLPDRTLAKRDALFTSLCVATAGQPPVLPAKTCEQVAPVTLLSTSGGQTGKNGWVVSPLTIALTARDASGLGIAHTDYSFDGLNFSQYTGPFVAPEGAVTIYYRSIDGNGNVEQMRRQAFKIDTRSPLSQATSTAGTNTVTLTYTVTDPVPGSGPAGLHTISHSSSGATVVQFTPGASGAIAISNTVCDKVEYWGEDVAGNEETLHHNTSDLVPPILSIAPETLCLWPPNHQRARFRLGADIVATVTDNCDPSPRAAIVSVTSSEPDDGTGDGDTSGDVAFSPSAFCVRRERSGSGPGRVYTVTVEATDSFGNATRKAVRVRVPHQAELGCGVAGTTIADTAPCE